MDWYVVHTQAQREGLANFSLIERGYETLWLHEEGSRKLPNGRRIPKLVSYFPRYVFVGCGDDRGLYDANNAPGVSTILYSTDGPYRLSQDAIDELRAKGNGDGLIVTLPAEREARELLCRGQRVKITGGPLRGLFATVEVDSGAEVKLLISMFRGKVQAELDAKSLQIA